MKLEILLEKPSNKVLEIIFISSVVLFFIFLAIFAPLLAQFPAGAGLYDMKDAWTKENMDKIIAIWKKNGLNHYVQLMFLVHFYDGFFMVIYGTAVFTGLLLAARFLSEYPMLQKFYLWLSVFSWLATIFDVIEQINILIMLSDPTHINGINVFGASLATKICISILYPCVAIAIIGLVASAILYLKKK